MKQAGWYFFSILIVLPFIVSAGKNDTVNESKKPLCCYGVIKMSHSVMRGL